MKLPIRSERRPVRRTSVRGKLARAVLWSLALLLNGCSDSSVSPPAPVQIVFEPAAAELDLSYGTRVTFSVSASSGPTPLAAFYRGSALLGTGSSYLYDCAQVGLDSLRAEAYCDSDTIVKNWQLRVDAGWGDCPAPVGVYAAPGLRPGGLTIRWASAAPALNPRPIVLYHVAVAYDAPLTEADWPGNAILASVPYNGALLAYALEPAGLPQGSVAAVGVRAEDDRGVLSPLVVTAVARVPAAWWLSGHLIDPAGQALEGLSVVVGSLPEYRTLSAADGSFTLPRSDLVPEGFRDIDKFVLSIRDELDFGRVGRWYDIRSDSLGVADDVPLDIIMIPGRDEYGETLMQTECGIIATYAGPEIDVQEFLLYLRSMTRTTYVTQPRLFKWDAWPVHWWLRQPAWSDSGSFDFVPLFRAATAAWNSRLGADCFVEVADSLAADLWIAAETMNSNLFGMTSIVEPEYAPINTIVPSRMRIQVRRDLRYENLAAGVVVHELGHALCLGAHGECEDPYLQIMRDGAHEIEAPAPGESWISNMAAAIAPEERLAAHLVRLLPQRVNMHQYLLD